MTGSHELPVSQAKIVSIIRKNQNIDIGFDLHRTLSSLFRRDFVEPHRFIQYGLCCLHIPRWMVISAMLAVILTFLERMLCQLTAYRTYLSGGKAPIDHTDA